MKKYGRSRKSAGWYNMPPVCKEVASTSVRIQYSRSVGSMGAGAERAEDGWQVRQDDDEAGVQE